MMKEAVTVVHTQGIDLEEDTAKLSTIIHLYLYKDPEGVLPVSVLLLAFHPLHHHHHPHRPPRQGLAIGHPTSGCLPSSLCC